MGGGAAAGGSGSGSGAGDPRPGPSAAGTPGPAPSPEGLCDLAKRSLDRAVTCLPADKRDSLASTGQVLSGLPAAPQAGLRAAAGEVLHGREVCAIHLSSLWHEVGHSVGGSPVVE